MLYRVLQSYTEFYKVYIQCMKTSLNLIGSFLIQGPLCQSCCGSHFEAKRVWKTGGHSSHKEARRKSQ